MTSVKKIVATVVVTILTILFPISIVVRTDPILSTNFFTKGALATPFFSICLILNIFTLVSAVSDDEKNADKKIPIIITINRIIFVVLIYPPRDIIMYDH